MSVLGIYRVLPKSQPLLCDSPGSWLKWPSVHRSVGQCHLLAGSVSPSPGLDAGCLSRLPGTAGDAASLSCLQILSVWRPSLPSLLSSVEKSVFPERKARIDLCCPPECALLALCSPCGWTLECPISLSLPLQQAVGGLRALGQAFLWGPLFFLSFHARGK